jgi:signal transduction histidine kinase
MGRLLRDGFWHGEVTHRRKDGIRVPIAVTNAARVDEQDKLVAVCTVCHDLTELKRVAESRIALATEQAARIAAEETVRRRDEFISIASHELRTPLTPLLLNLELAQRQIAERGGIEPGKLEVARRQVKRLERLVDGLLDVSRITSGRIELHREPLDLTELVRDLLARVVEEAKREGCELGLDAPAPVVGHWDRNRLEHAIVNVFANAIKYGPGKPIEVTIRARSGVAVLSVRDYGIGIEPENVERIFDRFERAVSSRAYGGLGLGLFITRQAVETLGGRVWVESRLGAGSTFTIELPLTSNDIAMPTARTS